jgi:hypothetical protein
MSSRLKAAYGIDFNNVQKVQYLGREKDVMRKIQSVIINKLLHDVRAEHERLAFQMHMYRRMHFINTRMREWFIRTSVI